MDAAVDVGRNPVSTRFSVSIENEQGDTRRDSQTCLAKPNSQVRTGTSNFFPVQLTMNRIGNLTRLICTLNIMTTHAYIHTVASSTPACYRGTWGLLRARSGDFFSPSAMVRWVCAKVLLLQNVLRKI